MKKTANVPWVFWIAIYKTYFVWFRVTRGANFLEINICGIRISIGQPWLAHVLPFPDYYCQQTYETNKQNLQYKFSILIERK